MDALNRIASASCSSAPCAGDSASYAIDRYGNRWSETGTLPGAAPPSLTFNSGANRADGGSFDANGNLLSDGVHSYQWDAENRLVSVDNGATASYVYDAESRRVHESVGGMVKEYLYGVGPESLTVVDGSQNTLQAEYSFAGRSLATVTAGALTFALTDTLGTVRARSNASGAMVETDTSGPYGEFRNYGNAASQIHFTGKLEDTETGLDYFGARYYAGNLGRFLTPDWSDSPDPTPYADLTNPQSLNLYSYVMGNPAASVDDDGHWPDWLERILDGGGDQCNTDPCQVTAPEPDPIPAQFALPVELAMFVYASEQRIATQVQQSELPDSTRNQPVLGASPFVPPEGEVGDLAEALSPAGRRILGKLVDPAGETVADAIKSRGGGAAQVRELETGMGERTVAEVAEAAARGQRAAAKAIKMIKQAAEKAQRY